MMVTLSVGGAGLLGTLLRNVGGAGNSLSICGMSTLIKSSLFSAVIYHMYMFLLPKTTIERMENIRRMFFWQGGKLKRKYHLVK
jgi:hypothetical protein